MLGESCTSSPGRRRRPAGCISWSDWPRRRGWVVCALVTPPGRDFLDASALERLTRHPGRSEYKRPGEPDVLRNPRNTSHARMRYDSRPMNAKTPDERKIRESRIATDDRLQVAHELFDRHAEEVYRYILAWTGEQASAGDLTTMVLRTAAARMDRLTGDADAAELETRLIALVRAAIIKWHAREPGQGPAPATAVPEESTPLFNGLGELDEGQREVLVLCELLGQELEHAGRLLGYDRSVMETRRHEALGSLWRAMNNAPPDQAVSIWDRLTVSTALRRAAAGWLSPSDEAVLAYVSAQLLSEAPAGVPATAPPHETDAKAPTGAKLVPNRPKVPATVAAAAATVAAATVAQAVALAPAVVLATAPKGPAPTAVPGQAPALDGWSCAARRTLGCVGYSGGHGGRARRDRRPDDRQPGERVVAVRRRAGVPATDQGRGRSRQRGGGHAPADLHDRPRQARPGPWAPDSPHDLVAHHHRRHRHRRGRDGRHTSRPRHYDQPAADPAPDDQPALHYRCATPLQ